MVAKGAQYTFFAIFWDRGRRKLQIAEKLAGGVAKARKWNVEGPASPHAPCPSKALLALWVEPSPQRMELRQAFVEGGGRGPGSGEPPGIV